MEILNNSNKFNIKDLVNFINISRKRTTGSLVYYVCTFNDSFQLIEHSKCNQEAIYNPITDSINNVKLSRKEKLILQNEKIK